MLMINRIFLASLIVLIASQTAAAQSSIHADYHIMDEGVFVELNFGSVNDFRIEIPYDSSDIEVISDEDYSVDDFGRFKIVSVDSSQSLKIRYITETMIDRSGDKNFFVMRNTFEEPIDIKVYLPEGALLHEEGIFFPLELEKSTDGRVIILTYISFTEEQIIVTYRFTNNDNLVLLLISAFLLVALVAAYLIERRKLKRELKSSRMSISRAKKERMSKRNKDITMNLFEDERRIVKYLIGKKKNECWTKEIIGDLEISKVRLSRKLRSLEQKGLIKKIPYGNENRIRLVK